MKTQCLRNALIVLLATLVQTSAWASSSSPTERSRCYATAILKDGLFSSEVPKKADFILVDKTNKRLYLWHKNRVLKSYNVALGFAPSGHKQQEGDGRTPEGIYSINLKNPQSLFFLSLGISYPNAADRKSAAERGVSPGGDIMIHGLPNDPLKFKLVSLIHPFYNWTDGCIAVSNEEIQEIYSAVNTGTRIEICP
jgi:murein L,D-transpeptidase YafK